MARERREGQRVECLVIGDVKIQRMTLQVLFCVFSGSPRCVVDRCTESKCLELTKNVKTITGVHTANDVFLQAWFALIPRRLVTAQFGRGWGRVK